MYTLYYAPGAASLAARPSTATRSIRVALFPFGGPRDHI